MALFSAGKATAGDTYLQVWPSQLSEKFRQIERVQSVWKNMLQEDGLVCAPGQRLRARQCVTFIQNGKGSCKDDGDQLVAGWTSCNRLEVQPS